MIFPSGLTIGKRGGPLHGQYWEIENHLLKIKECRIENGWDILLLEHQVGHHKAFDLVKFLAS